MSRSAMRIRSLLIALIAFPPAFAQQLVMPTLDNVWIPMRDGDSLQADVYIPAGVDSAQVILVQTPYNKDLYSLGLPMGVGWNVDDQPYIWVFVDWRGFYGSSNADPNGSSHGEDGYDVCEWITQQPWHRDRIGTWGPSALGDVQWLTAEEHHPAHTCAVPLVSDAQQAYVNYFTGGVLEQARLQSLVGLGFLTAAIITANPYYNGIWQAVEAGTWFPPNVAIPTLQIGGWYDHHADRMVDIYAATRAEADPAVQDEQWLLMGPWVHGGTGLASVGTLQQGELTYPTAQRMNDSLAWRFFDHYLLDSANGWENSPRVMYFEMGGNDLWHTTNDPDFAATGTTPLFLDTGGSLNSTGGTGQTSFASDPADPSPTIGGATLSPDLDQGPYDQTPLEARGDVIAFRTGELPVPFSSTGRIVADLYVSADQPDCDIAVRLADEYPDGRNMLITDGIRRMRFRTGYTQADEAFMTPGVVYHVQVDLPFTCYTWLPDHRIKIYISGNNATRYHVNPQNGGPMYLPGDTNVAVIDVHHDATYPSTITLAGTNPPLGVAAREAGTIRVFPSPVSDELHADGVRGDWAILDVHGRTVLRGGGVEKGIDVGGLHPGAYTLQARTEAGRPVSARFVRR
ncbi:MAG: CocE/NonD family hydrolase [Flavobacteriales bacterium]|nr:CocE/NonD family hydrolase [Flavobacteriales bacterium]MCB9194509.1 CocE/NonD family hydrolase [Flavobacteriales bacterium]